MDRIVEKWSKNKQWERLDFDDLEPGDIARFDCNDSSIVRVDSYPFLSSRYSFDGSPVQTIICMEELYYLENR